MHALTAYKDIIRSRWNINKTPEILSPGLIKPLTLIINQSLITGIFPEKLKLAKVIPLYKKDDKLIMGNYRPISLLTSISKLFEKIAFEQLSDYFSSNNYFHDGQYGFREKHSTELATVELMDRIISTLNDKLLPISISMDLSKAFDTLDHVILLEKLRYYGINGTSLDWFEATCQIESSMLRSIMRDLPVYTLRLEYHKGLSLVLSYSWYTWTTFRMPVKHLDSFYTRMILIYSVLSSTQPQFVPQKQTNC